MTVAYFDCFAGISGDMTLGALIDAGGDRAVLDAAVEAMRLGEEVGIELDVHSEILGLLPFSRSNAMSPAEHHALEVNPVHVAIVPRWAWGGVGR